MYFDVASQNHKFKLFDKHILDIKVKQIIVFLCNQLTWQTRPFSNV